MCHGLTRRHPASHGGGRSHGFHEPWDPKTKESSRKGDALIGNYARQLRLPLDAVTFFVNAGPRSMAWLTEASSSVYRIFYVELRRDQAERYREILTALHADAPIPACHITIDRSSGSQVGPEDAKVPVCGNPATSAELLCGGKRPLTP